MYVGAGNDGDSTAESETQEMAERRRRRELIAFEKV